MLKCVLAIFLLFSSCSNETINNLVLENENLKKKVLERDEEIKKLENEIKDIEFEIKQLKASENKLYFELKTQKEVLAAVQTSQIKRAEVPQVTQAPTKSDTAKTIEQWALFLDKKKKNEIRDLLGKPSNSYDSGLRWSYRNKTLEADSGLIKDLHLFFLPRDFFGKSEQAVTFLREDFFGKIVCVNPIDGTVKYVVASDISSLRGRLETWIRIKNGSYKK